MTEPDIPDREVLYFPENDTNINVELASVSDDGTIIHPPASARTVRGSLENLGDVLETNFDHLQPSSPGSRLGSPSSYRSVGQSSYQSPVKENGFQSPVRETGFQSPVRETGFQSPVRETGFQSPERETGFQTPVREPSEHSHLSNTPDHPVPRSLFETPVDRSQGTPVNLDQEHPKSRMPDGATKLKCTSAVLVIFVALVTSVVLSAIHKIEEGSVGIYFKYGALLDTLTHPGIHYMTPFIVDVTEVQIRPQTDTLKPVVSITKDGIQNSFLDVQVISRVKVDQLILMVRKFGTNFRNALIYDRVKEELRIFCANHTIDEVYNTQFLDIVRVVKMNLVDSIERLGDGGLDILNLVIPKPDIPADIAQNYKQVKVQWTEQLVATQQQRTEQIKKETEKMRAIADAERNKAVLEIKIMERIIEKDGEKNISTIQNLIVKEKEENLADVAQYRTEKEAVANGKLYTDKYVQLNLARAMTENTKFYFSGESSQLGSILTSVFKN